MPFTFDDYESFARRLKESSKEEDLRNSVSRAYYSIYHKIKNLLGYMNSRFIRHEDLVSQLGNSDLKNGHRLSSAMQTMKEEREQADYYIKNHTNKAQIEFTPLCIVHFWGRYERLVKMIEEEKEGEE